MTLKDSSIHFFLFRPMTIKFNHSVLHETLPMVSALNNENWHQMNGRYYNKKFSKKIRPCCIGAHLAHYFQSSNKNIDFYSYSKGYEEFYKKLNLTWQIVDKLLFICGAPINPFGEIPYKSHPKDIWKRLMTIESIIDEDKFCTMCHNMLDGIRNHNIIVDKPELFEGVLEFNAHHPKFKKVKDKKLALV